MNKQTEYGLNNEVEIIKYLHKKRICELNDKWKKHILKMFLNANEEDVIYARHYPDGSAKPDMIVEVDDEEKYVSIKTGKNPSVHHEAYYSFQRFLKRQGVDNRTLKIIRFFHFGDSKKLQTRGKPLSLKEMEKRFSSYFLEASKALDNEKIISAVIKRAILQGTSPSKKSIDFLYYGDLENGKLISKEEIYKMVLSYRTHGYSQIHFGGLNYMPNSRKVGARDRNSMRIKWPLLSFLYYCSDEDIELMKEGKFTKK